VTDEQVDQLRRELLIAATASRKLATALSIAWAQLTDERFSSPIRGPRSTAAAAAQKKNSPADQRDLPF